MRPKTKYQVIYRHRTEYPISVMCRFFGVSRSGYYDFVRRADRPEKDKELADIIAMQRKRCWGTYGYRRMCLWLRSQSIYKNPKTVLRIIKSMICCPKYDGVGNGFGWAGKHIDTKTY